MWSVALMGRRKALGGREGRETLVTKKQTNLNYIYITKGMVATLYQQDHHQSPYHPSDPRHPYLRHYYYPHPCPLVFQSQ